MNALLSRASLVLSLTLALCLPVGQAHAGVLTGVKNVARNIKAEWKAAAGRREIKRMIKPGAITTLGINDPKQAVRQAYTDAQGRHGVADKAKVARGERINSALLFTATAATACIGQPAAYPLTIATLLNMGESGLRHEQLREAKDRSLIDTVVAARKNGLPVSENQKIFVERSLQLQEQNSADHASWAGHVLAKMKHNDPKKGVGSKLKNLLYKAWSDGDAGRFLSKRASDKAYVQSVREAMK